MNASFRPSKAMPAYDLQTERLLLRPFRLADAGALHQLWTAPAVRRFLWDDEVIPFEQTRGIIRRSTQLFAEHGFGLWALMHRRAAALVGFGGYWYFRRPPELELVLGLDAAWWGQGLATEAGKALIGYAFARLGFDEVRGSTDAGNAASVRLMERLGLRFERRAVVGGLDTLFYSLPGGFGPVSPP